MSQLKPEEAEAQQSPKHVYLLSYHRPSENGWWSGMLVGVYSSLDEVEKAKTRLLSRPGFREFPSGFRVDGWVLNVEYDDPQFFAGVGPVASNAPKRSTKQAATTIRIRQRAEPLIVASRSRSIQTRPPCGGHNPKIVVIGFARS
jgi:hypothetical protein